MRANKAFRACERLLGAVRIECNHRILGLLEPLFHAVGNARICLQPEGMGYARLLEVHPARASPLEERALGIFGRTWRVRRGHPEDGDVREAQPFARGASCVFPWFWMTARTASACPSTFTLGYAWTILRSGPMTKVLRMVPVVVFP